MMSLCWGLLAAAAQAQSITLEFPAFAGKAYKYQLITQFLILVLKQ